jgi:hypothetical protein
MTWQLPKNPRPFVLVLPFISLLKGTHHITFVLCTWIANGEQMSHHSTAVDQLWWIRLVMAWIRSALKFIVYTLQVIKIYVIYSIYILQYFYSQNFCYTLSYNFDFPFFHWQINYTYKLSMTFTTIGFMPLTSIVLLLRFCDVYLNK